MFLGLPSSFTNHIKGSSHLLTFIGILDLLAQTRKERVHVRHGARVSDCASGKRETSSDVVKRPCRRIHWQCHSTLRVANAKVEGWYTFLQTRSRVGRRDVL